MAGIVSPPSLITHVTNNACYHSPGSLPVKTQQTLRHSRRVCCCYCEERKTTQLPALVGDDHAGGRPLKDGDMQLLLQSVYQIADAGLGDVQLLVALLNDPHRSTMDTYFSCCNVIRTPSLSRGSAPTVQARRLCRKPLYFSPFSATQPRTYSTNRRVEADSARSSFTAMPMLR